MSNGGGSRPVNFRILEEESKKKRRGVPKSERNCEVEGCEGTPTENKPYCIDHLDRDPRIKRLMRSEAGMASKSGIQEIKKDILNCLKIHGWASYQLLYDNVDGDRNVVHKAVEQLVKANLIIEKEEIHRRRGKKIVKYFEPISA